MNINSTVINLSQFLSIQIVHTRYAMNKFIVFKLPHTIGPTCVS